MDFFCSTVRNAGFGLPSSLQVVYVRCTMHRTNIYLTERQQKALQKEAQKLGVSVAELIRRILDRHLDRRQK